MTIWKRPDAKKFGPTEAPFINFEGIELHGGIWENPYYTMTLLVGEKKVTYTVTKKNGAVKTKTKMGAGMSCSALEVPFPSSS